VHGMSEPKGSPDLSLAIRHKEASEPITLWGRRAWVKVRGVEALRSSLVVVLVANQMAGFTGVPACEARCRCRDNFGSTTSKNDLQTAENCCAVRVYERLSGDVGCSCCTMLLCFSFSCVKYALRHRKGRRKTCSRVAPWGGRIAVLGLLRT
jgi:hypothetical protein